MDEFPDFKEFQKTYKPESSASAASAPTPTKQPTFKTPKGVIEAASTVADMIKGTKQGVSVGFSDELQGINTALGQKPGAIAPDLPEMGRKLMAYLQGKESISDEYKKGRDTERQTNKEAEARSPWAYGTGDFVGSIGPAALTGGESTAARLLGYMGQGAARGLGTSEGETIMDDVGNAVGGAATGLAFGGAGEGLGAVTKPFLKAFMPTRSTLGEQYGKAHDAAVAGKKPHYVLSEIQKNFQRKRSLADKEAKKSLKGTIAALEGKGEALGSALGVAGGAALGGPTGGLIGSLVGKDFGGMMGNELKGYLAKRYAKGSLPGARVDLISNEAEARLLNAFKDQTPRMFGKITERGIATPVGTTASQYLGGYLNSAGDTLMNQLPNSTPAEEAEKEIESQTNPAAREAERKKRSE